MAVYRIFPEKDAFIFSESPDANAGLDEILEIGGYQDIAGVGETSRMLLQFSNEEIQTVINNHVGTSSYSANLGIYLADAYQIPIKTSIYTYPIYSTVEWDNGTGKYGDVPVNSSGVTWSNLKAGNSEPWVIGSYPTGVTGSYITGKEGGGAWYTSYGSINLEFIQENSIKSTYDIYTDVTDAVKLWNEESIINNGFIVKLNKELEFNTTASIRLKYFSSDTNTIYPPFLDIKWDDSTYNTGSLPAISTDTISITVNNNRGKYPDIGKQRFRISAKPKYPVRTFTTSSIYLQNYSLPPTSYWGLRDENTEEMVVDFDDNFTKISCDEKGNYFDIYMSGLQPERYYRILIKSVIDGTTTVIDNNNIFKVVRNG